MYFINSKFVKYYSLLENDKSTVEKWKVGTFSHTEYFVCKFQVF